MIKPMILYVCDRKACKNCSPDCNHTSILEMICDWWSFSWKTGNLYEIFNWYDAHKDYIKMHPKSRKKVETITQ